MLQLSQAVADEEGRRGIAGQVDKATLDIACLFINVDRANECLNELNAGKSLEEVMNLYRDRNLHGQDPTYMKKGTFSNNRSWYGLAKAGHDTIIN